VQAGTYLVRLFNSTRHAQTALTFRYFGPLLRFDHHVVPGTRAAFDRSHAIYYAGLTLSGCLAEIFGDLGEINCGEWQVARPWVTRPLTLLNIQGFRAMRAGSVAALAKTPDHRQSQQWSRYFYAEHDYRQCDGILYDNAHNDEPTIALYERAADALSCPASSVIRLDEPSLRPEIVSIARRHNMVCEP
jgi:hypothetical protein